MTHRELCNMTVKTNKLHEMHPDRVYYARMMRRIQKLFDTLFNLQIMKESK